MPNPCFRADAREAVRPGSRLTSASQFHSTQCDRNLGGGASNAQCRVIVRKTVSTDVGVGPQLSWPIPLFEAVRVPRNVVVDRQVENCRLMPSPAAYVATMIWAVSRKERSCSMRSGSFICPWIWAIWTTIIRTRAKYWRVGNDVKNLGTGRLVLSFRCS